MYIKAEKLCPLRKTITHYNNGEDVETFMPCIKDECMWYRTYRQEGICMLAVEKF